MDYTSPVPDALLGGIISIGNFDGVHRGHRRLLSRLRSRARSLKVPAVAVSFDPHPIAILRPERAPVPLAWPERKVSLLKGAGADGVVLYRATPEFLDLTAEEFFQQIVLGRLKARGMVEGPDFGFGKGRSGNIEVLRGMCDQAGLSLDVVSLVHGDGAAVSSTRIRTLLGNGDVAQARTLLGRPHCIRGTVVHGDERGRTLGFPTANLRPVVGFLPAEGVYAAKLQLGKESFAAAVNLGPNPTFQVHERKVEVHLLDFAGDLYGQTLEVELLQHLRPTRPFHGIDALKKQLEQDIADARAIYASEPHARPPEIALTIEEWLRDEIEPALRPLEGRLLSAEFHEQGRLVVRWDLPKNQIPTDRFELLFTLEQRLREVFPEVQYVESESVGLGNE